MRAGGAIVAHFDQHNLAGSGEGGHGVIRRVINQTNQVDTLKDLEAVSDFKMHFDKRIGIESGVLDRDHDLTLVANHNIGEADDVVTHKGSAMSETVEIADQVEAALFRQFNMRPGMYHAFMARFRIFLECLNGVVALEEIDRAGLAGENIW